MMRADVPRPELRATAFVRSSRPTIWNTSVCRAGASSAIAIALDEAEHVQLPDGDHARQREHGEQRRVHREHGLARHDHPPQIDPVGDRAADERERGDRERLHERECSHRHRGVRELEHEPVRSDLLHPRADERDAAAGEVEPVVAVAPQAAEGAVAERGERGDRLQA